jgi:hypothetical protein
MPPESKHTYESVIDEIARRLGYPVAKARRDFYLDAFSYVLNYLPATASVTTTQSFTVMADSAFAICKCSFTVASTAEAYVANLSDIPRFAPFLVTMVDSGAGRELSDNAQAINGVYGAGEWPNVWAIPKILKPSANFQVRVQNLIGTDRNVRLTHQGYKIFGDVQKFLSARGL